MDHDAVEVTIRITNLEMLHNPTQKAMELLVDTHLREARRMLLARVDAAKNDNRGEG